MGGRIELKGERDTGSQKPGFQNNYELGFRLQNHTCTNKVNSDRELE